MEGRRSVLDAHEDVQYGEAGEVKLIKIHLRKYGPDAPHDYLLGRVLSRSIVWRPHIGKGHTRWLGGGKMGHPRRGNSEIHYVCDTSSMPYACMGCT